MPKASALQSVVSAADVLLACRRTSSAAKTAHLGLIREAHLGRGTISSRTRRQWAQTRSAACSAGDGTTGGIQSAGAGFPSNIGWVPAQQPRSSKPNWPNYVSTREEAVQTQLQALQRNNDPHKDFGVEVLYRFANIDLLCFNTLNRYFGRTLDLGRFELFRMQFNEPPFALLLDHRESNPTSSLQLAEDRWVQWVAVTGANGTCATFEFTMCRRVGGRHDGFWFTDSLKHQPDL